MFSVGIDIGASSVKLAELNLGNKSHRLTRYVEFPIKLDPSFDRKIETLDVLRKIAEHYSQVDAKFVVGLKQDVVSLRDLVFPFRERLKIQKSLAFELEDEIPFEQDNCVADFKVIRYIDKNAKVLACVSPKTNVKNLIDQVSESGIEIDIMSIDALAFANVFENWENIPESKSSEPPVPGPLPANVIVHMGHESTLIVTQVQDRVVSTRAISWGGRKLLDKLIETYKIHFVEALDTLQTKSFVLISEEGATKEQIAFSQVIGHQINELARELKLYFLETASLLELEFKQVLLCGGVSQIKNLAPYLTQLLEVPCNKIKSLPRPARVETEGASFSDLTGGVALGLAIEGAKKIKNPPINLLQKEFAKKNRSVEMFFEKWSYTMKLVGACWLAFLFFAVARDYIGEELSNQSYSMMREQAARFPSLKSPRTTREDMQALVRQKFKQAKALDDLQGVNNIDSAANVLGKVSSILGKELGLLDVKAFSVNDRTFKLEGLATQNSLPRIQNALKSIALGNIKTYKPSLDATADRVAFGFEMQVKRER